MAEFFIEILNMSISSVWLILAVILLRIMLKNAPKRLFPVLWGIVGLRLIIPFKIESILSLVPSGEVVNPHIMMSQNPAVDMGIPAIDNSINPFIAEHFTPQAGASMNPLQFYMALLAFIWLMGIGIMVIHSLISYFHLKRKVSTAVLMTDNIYQSENVISPFVMGIIKPKIYLSFDINDNDMSYIIAHEKAHIRRHDNLWKPLGFAVLAVHWFNPAVWLGYILLCRDIELACDEKVILNLGSYQRADYSQALLNCAVHQKIITACPVAFGEIGVKTRVKTILNYKKPAFWIILASAAACVLLCLCFLTNPPAHNGMIMIDNIIYTQGKALSSMERGSEEIGRIMGITDDEYPTGNFQAVNLPKEYDGLPIFQNENAIYIPASEGFIIFEPDEKINAEYAASALKTLRADDIEKIEIMCFPASPDKNYGIADKSLYDEIAEFLNHAKIKHIKNPEPITGGAITLEITKKDGAVLTVTNSGNTYLIVFNTFFDAPYEWLEKWEKYRSLCGSAMPEEKNHTVNKTLLFSF